MMANKTNVDVDQWISIPAENSTMIASDSQIARPPAWSPVSAPGDSLSDTKNMTPGPSPETTDVLQDFPLSGSWTRPPLIKTNQIASGGTVGQGISPSQQSRHPPIVDRQSSSPAIAGMDDLASVVDRHLAEIGASMKVQFAKMAVDVDSMRTGAAATRNSSRGSSGSNGSRRREVRI